MHAPFRSFDASSPAASTPYYPGTYLDNPSYRFVDEPFGYSQSPFDMNPGRLEGPRVNLTERPSLHPPVLPNPDQNAWYDTASTIQEVESGWSSYGQAALQEPQEPSSFSESPYRSVLARDKIPDPYPDDSSRANTLPPAQPSLWDTPTLRVPCNAPSPSTASSASRLFEDYSGAGSPATSVEDSHSPGWQAEMSFGAPAVAAVLVFRPPPVDPEDLPWPALGPGFTLRRCEDQDAVVQPVAKKARTHEYSQEINLPSLPNGLFKRKRDEDDSIDEALMKKKRGEKRPAHYAEMQARRDSTEALRRQDNRFAGPSRGYAPTHEDRTKLSICEVEGPEQAPSSSSSQIEPVVQATPTPMAANQTTPTTKKRFPCRQHGCTTTCGRQVELKRHTLTVHGVLARLPCPHCSKPLCGRTDSLSRHLREQHGYDAERAMQEAKAAQERAKAANGV